MLWNSNFKRAFNRLKRSKTNWLGKKARIFSSFGLALFVLSGVAVWQFMPALAAPQGNLVGYWKLDESSGTNVADVSGNDNNGTHANTPTQSTDTPTTSFPNSHSLGFDGIDDYVNVDNPFANGQTDFTVSLWVNPATISTGDYQGLIGRQVGEESSERAPSLWVAPSGGGLHYNVFSADTETGFNGIIPNVFTSADEWVQITWVKSGTNLFFYKNGVQLSGSYSAPETFFTGGNSYNFGFVDKYFQGKLDDIRIYNRALSSTEAGDLGTGKHTSATWTGNNGNSDWHDPGNWNLNATPDAYTNIISTNSTGEMPQLTSDIELASLTIDQGYIRLSGHNIVFNDEGAFNNTGTFILEGNETLTNFTNDTDSGLLMYEGSDTYPELAAGYAYNNVSFVGSGEWTLDSNISVNGLFNIDTPATVRAEASILSVKGFWYNLGSFLAGTSTVNLTGADQYIIGSTTFYNLHKSVTSTATLAFEANQTQTITNQLTLTGAQDNLLSLSSDPDNAQFIIDPQGPRNISYVNVQDSNNINAAPITYSSTNVYGQNLTGWNTTPPPPTVANPIPNQSATEDAPFNFQFAANTFASAGGTLTYSAQLAGGGALPAWLAFDTLTRTFSGTPSNANVGSISVDVIADDGTGGTITDTFNITIANTNDAPTVSNPIPNQSATEDAPFNFQFAANTFNDVDTGTTLTYSAQLAGGGSLPAWLNFNSATRTFSGTPSNADIGTISIDVIADDGDGGTIADTFNIEVNSAPNEGPSDILLSNTVIQQSATAAGETVGTLSSTDTDSSDFIYTLVSAATAVPGSCTTDQGNNSFQIEGSTLETAASLAVGSYYLCIQTNDGNSSYKKGFTITVTDDVGPTANILVSDNSLAAGQTTQVTITFGEAVTGFDNTDLTVANGTLSAVSSSDSGITWTATLTPNPGITDPTNVITLDNTGVVDLNDNAGTGVTISNNYSIDTAAPEITNIAATSTSNGESATITWITDEVASSQIALGLTHDLVNEIYSEQDTTPRVVNHSYQLPNLKPCTSYYYQVLSKDALNQQAVSTVQVFTTNGCPGTVMAHAEEFITRTNGGSLNLDKVTVTIPSGFAASDATFQIKRIDASEAQTTIGKPDTLLVIGGSMYHLQALTNTTTTINDFLQPINITFDYSDSNLAEIDPDTLIIYHYDDSDGWSKLTNCSSNIAANIITCETSSFSTFALFAQAATSGTAPLNEVGVGVNSGHDQVGMPNTGLPARSIFVFALAFITGVSLLISFRLVLRKS